MINNIKIHCEHSVLRELFNCCKAYRAWIFLGYYEIKLSYRRTMLGPLWTTLSTSITISIMSFFWAKLFQVELAIFLPHVICGYITWAWINRSMNNNVEIFVGKCRNEILFNNKTPIFHVFRVSATGVLTFLHQIVIVIFIYMIFPVQPSWHALYLFPLAMFVIFINSFFVTSILACMNVKYRDIKPLFESVLPPLMLITPVIWLPSMLGKHASITNFNPFTHFLAIIRDPLLNNPFNPLNWLIVGIISICHFLLFLLIYHNFRRKLVFWL